MADTNKQREIVERLQLKWLERMEQLLDDGELSSTDAATLYRFMSDNGWSLDPSKLPQSLKDKLTDKVEFDEEDEFGLQVVR
jgi:hypothetical protein